LATGGALSGLAAWTKNEGLLFLAITCLLLGWLLLRARQGRQIAWWFAGAVPAAATVLWLKLVLAPVPPPYLLEAQTTDTILDRLFGAGGLAILGTIGERSLAWGGPFVWGAVPLALVAAALASSAHRQGPSGMMLGSVVLMAAGYYAVFVATPLDAVKLAADTMDRLLAQVWPALVLAACFVGDARATARAAERAER
jgi:hypothetical protein